MVCVLGLLVLAGWALDLEAFQHIGPGLVAMNPLTAAGFTIAGASLWLSLRADADTNLRWDPSRGFRRSFTASRLALAGSISVALIGLFQLACDLFGVKPRLDQLLFASRLGVEPAARPDPMAPITAACFAMAGSALWLIRLSREAVRRAAQGMAAATGLVSLLALVGYAFSKSSLYGAGHFLPMALHTAVPFLMLALGIGFGWPERGFMTVLTSPHAGGVMARRLLPAVVLIPPSLAALRLLGERAGVYDTEFGIALFVVATVCIFAVLTYSCAATLNQAEAHRQAAQDEVRRLNADLSHRAALLQEANQEMEAFSYTVSHDLRAPLRHINGFVDLLIKTSPASLPDKSQRYLRVISESAKRMGQLIDDLLVFSRTGRTDLHKAPVALAPLVREVIYGLQHETRGRQVDWKIGTLPVLQADASLLRVVMTNLLSNAVEYTRNRERAHIEVGTTPDPGQQVIVHVRDNGVGFDMQYAGKLFGVFQRLHRPEHFEGTGIGLATVRQIIARHGGRVWAEAEPGQGATFYFSLPSPATEPPETLPARLELAQLSEAPCAEPLPSTP